MSLVLDTNVLLCWVRNDATWHYLRGKYDLAGDAAKPIVSAVSIGEILAIAHRNDWGAKKRDDLERVIAALRIIEVDYSEILDVYAELDKFSRQPGRTPDRQGSAISIGKNDLWIAATAVVAEAALLTSDNDFDHFNEVYFEVIKYHRQPG